MKERLTKTKIAAKALQLIDENGLDSLSMRNLAKALQVEAASLYNHVANKSELYDLVQTEVYRNMQLQTRAKSWQSHLKNLADGFRALCKAHPHLLPLMASRPTRARELFTQLEVSIAILLDAGFKANDALLIFQSIAVFVTGHALAEVGTSPEPDTEPDELTANQLSAFPILQSIFATDNSDHYEKWYEIGINSMIKGFGFLIQNREINDDE